MKRVKFKISTWDLGKEFMNQISEEFETEMEERDDNLVIINENFEINFHPDDRGFAFISCKIHNDSVESILKNKIEQYTKET